MRGYNNQQSGYSLVSILIGTALSLIMLGSILQGIVSFIRTNHYQQTLLRLHENGRFALYKIRKGISSGGYLGCSNNVVPNNIIKESDRLNGAAIYNYGILGFDPTSTTSNNRTNWTPALSNYFSDGEVKAGTDVIAIQSIEYPGATLQEDMSSDSSDIKINNSLTPQAGDVVLIYDCDNSDLLRVTKVTQSGHDYIIEYSGTYNIKPSGSSENNGKLSKAYTCNAAFARFKNNAFFIADNNRGGTSLWEYTLSKGGIVEKSELVEGVEDMQIRYGIDTNNDGSANAYVIAGAITDWDKVVSAKLNLLLNSVDRVTHSPVHYTFMGQAKTANDGLLRKSFAATIKLRSKGAV